MDETFNIFSDLGQLTGNSTLSDFGNTGIGNYVSSKLTKKIQVPTQNRTVTSSAEKNTSEQKPSTMVNKNLIFGIAGLVILVGVFAIVRRK